MQRMILAVVVVLLLLLGGVVMAQRSGPDLSQQYIVENGMASGGGYQLASLTWQVSGTASGGDYRLLCPAAAFGRGSGCCCTYLPMMLRNY